MSIEDEIKNMSSKKRKKLIKHYFRIGVISKQEKENILKKSFISADNEQFNTQKALQSEKISDEEKRATRWKERQEKELLERIRNRKTKSTNVIDTADETIIIYPKDDKRFFNDVQRSEIYLRDKGTCQICKCFVSISNYDADHIIPFSKGGKTEISNGQCTCRKCNRSKGNRIF